jgi:tetratricopeptide (TPR) repeat protein
MPTRPEFEDAPPRDVDIAKPHSWGWLHPRTNWGWWLVFFLSLAIIGLGQKWPTEWLVWALVGLVVFICAARIGWLIVRNGVLTWMRLARSPGRATARGDAAGAERALAAALARARQFSPHDYRRGLMVVELAGHLKNLGRSSEAKALFEEGVEILRQRWKSSPLEYFIALNNLAVNFIEIQDWAAAQRILEKVLDLTLLWIKGGLKPGAAVPTAPFIELILHLNLVVLFIRMEELALAADHLEEADALFDKLVKPRKQLGEHYRGVRAYLLFAEGRFTMAAKELDKVKNSETPACLAVRAKLSLARGEFSQAEQLLRKYLDLEGKKGSVHRPGLRDQVLELAESLFGQGKCDEAFNALEEARAITRDFALPAASAWRKALADWLQRAQQLGRTADIASLEADLHRMSIAPEQAVTISPRLRIRPPTS